MQLSEQTRQHVITTYVEPARRRGETTIRVKVGTILKELGWTNRTPSVFSTLESQLFQAEARVELIDKSGGPASGGPSTSWVFTYKLRETALEIPASERPVPDGYGLKKLIGCCADVFRKLGGGEAFLRAEREWGPDPWERLAGERQKEKEPRNDK